MHCNLVIQLNGNEVASAFLAHSCSFRHYSRNVHRASQYQWLAVGDCTQLRLVQLAMGSKYVSDRKGHSVRMQLSCERKSNN